MGMVASIIKKAMWFVLLLPTAFLAIRGFTLAIGQGTEAFGAVMTDLISQIVFWLFAAFGTIYVLSYIGTKVYERYMGKGIKPISKGRRKNYEYPPKLELRINSKDFTKRNSKQISEFFKGIRQSLTEYRKALKEWEKSKGNSRTE